MKFNQYCRHSQALVVKVACTIHALNSHLATAEVNSTLLTLCQKIFHHIT